MEVNHLVHPVILSKKSLLLIRVYPRLPIRVYPRPILLLQPTPAPGSPKTKCHQCFRLPATLASA
jgi:hypothetical protein